jgi:hypothetical protein
MLPSWLIYRVGGQVARVKRCRSHKRRQSWRRAKRRACTPIYCSAVLLAGVRAEEARALTWDRVHMMAEGDLPPHVEVWRSVRKGGDTKGLGCRTAYDAGRSCLAQEASVLAVPRRQEYEWSRSARFRAHESPG